MDITLRHWPGAPWLARCLGLALALVLLPGRAGAVEPALSVGFAEADITPKVDGKPVYLAGFGNNRKATGVHDPLKARAVVLRDGRQKIALVSVDLIGFFYPNVLNVRRQLPGCDYVLVSSTHNHEGPDTLGLWGPTTPLPRSGIDPEYLKRVEAEIVRAVQAADRAARQVTARIGTVKAPELLHDGREPQIKHDDLVVLTFAEPGKKGLAGLVVQWNCHPETLSSSNTLVSADYVGYTVDALSKKYQCPVVYFTGTVGGLMTSLHVPIQDDQGQMLADGTFEKTERYGRLLADRAGEAIARTEPLTLTPFTVRSRQVFVPVHNPLYKAAQLIKVLDRPTFVWTGDARRADPSRPEDLDRPQCVQTEVGRLVLGDLTIVAIPGEIYPELVLDRVQDPPDPGADFPDAPIEPAVFRGIKTRHRLILGLANDELGYILPRRQWDEKAPFCYGRKRAQYGEQNSLGPETAPILCEVLRELADGQ